MSSDFAKEVRDRYTEAEEADRKNCEEALIDLAFEAGNQWDETARRLRETISETNPFPLPCLTVNTAQAFTGIVVGAWQANQSSIRVLPREDGDKVVADVRTDLIRSIELQSKASRIYTSSLAQMVSCGISNFRIDIDYAYEDAFERDILIRDIPHPLAVKWDPLSTDPTGNDAEWNFVGDDMPTEAYKAQYKGKALPSLIQREAGSSWASGSTVTVAEYWQIVVKLRTLGMTETGATVDLTDIPRGKRPKLLIDPATNEPVIREKAKCKYAVMVKTNGMEELSDPYELKLHRLPIIRVNGREVWTEEGRVRFGLVRFMRDSLRFKNYSRSIRAELLLRAPRVNFIGPVSAFEGREGDWENTLAYNDQATAPPTPVTAQNISALLNEERICDQDLMEVTGIHQAMRGMPSNEKSGVAIRERQEEGDIATMWAHANMTSAQQEAGEVCNAFIPQVFDTARTIRTVGPDLGVKLMKINDPNDPEAVDLAMGKYDVTISTGPPYATRRQEMEDKLGQLFQADPELTKILGDIFLRSTDLPQADEMADRVKRIIPPEVLGDDADDEDPEVLAQKQQQAQKAEALKDHITELELRQKTAEVEKAEADARRAEAEADKAVVEAQAKRTEQSLDAAHIAETAANLPDDDEQDIAA